MELVSGLKNLTFDSPSVVRAACNVCIRYACKCWCAHYHLRLRSNQTRQLLHLSYNKWSCSKYSGELAAVSLVHTSVLLPCSGSMSSLSLFSPLWCSGVLHGTNPRNILLQHVTKWCSPLWLAAPARRDAIFHWKRLKLSTTRQALMLTLDAM